MIGDPTVFSRDGRQRCERLWQPRCLGHDPDQRSGRRRESFQTTVTGTSGNLGTLVLAANGSYTYTVANAATQSLGLGDTHVDTFTITSVDGTTKQVSFTINGTNDAPIVQSSNVLVPSDPSEGSELGYFLNVEAPSDVDGDALTFNLDNSIQPNVYYLVNGVPTLLQINTEYSVSILNSLFYIPTENSLDELTTTLNFTVSDSFGGASDFSVTVTEYAEDPLKSISEIVAPVNYGKSGTGTLVLSDGLSEVFGSRPETGQVTLYTDFGPKNGSEPSNVSYVDDELSVLIIVDGITFQVASGNVSEDWTYDPISGFKVSTVSFSDIIGTVGGSQITLEDYLESYPPSEGDEWQVIADDGVPGNNQARFVEVQVSTTSPVVVLHRPSSELFHSQM